MNRIIKKAAVLGSGVMGSRIACHFANIGLQVVLLDIVPRELTEDEKTKGLTTDAAAFRNRIVNDSLQFAIKSRPSPLYHKKFASRITTGNFDDNYDLIKDCDLILEAVIEDLGIKQKVFTRVEEFRKKGSIVASNTSGIPLQMMNEGRSEDFNRNFLGMHFFNPPRYLKLLEIIPTKLTDPGLVDFMMRFGDLHLGKTMVHCKDTPAFIANRVGVFALVKTLEMVEKLGLTIEETDKLTGSATGKPNTGTFRLADLIGNDTTQKVKNGLRDNLPNDEAKALFAMETILERVVEKGLYGDKMGKGFYQKTKERDATGRSVVLSLDLNSLEYRPFKKPEIGSLGPLKTMETLAERYKHLYKAKDKGGDFVRATTQALFAYVSNRIPEIADDLYKIDDALRAGFAWDIGPFEVWDMLGLVKRLEETEAAGFKVAAWVHEMVAAGHTSFYKVEGGNRLYYDRESKAYKVIPGTEELIVLDYLRDNKVVWKNSGASLFDIGDGVLNLEFQTKMNAIGSEVLQGVNKAIEIAEKEGWKGLVIGNNAVNFSAGANLAMILMLGIEQEFDEIDMAVRMFQQTNMRVRYSGIPVVVAPHGLTLGGGCEISLHADVVVAATETYMGLVEVGVGLLPAGGGTKELTVRMSDAYETGDVELNSLLNHFMTIGQAKVATSAHEAFDLNLMRRGDVITVNTSRQLGDAKAEVLRLHAEGYIQPTPRNDIRALGQTGLGLAYSGVYSMFAAGYISEHDLKIAKKIAWVMCGGDLSGTQLVSEQYLLDLEREAFLSLMGEKLTLERIQHMLKTGKPLRN